MRNRDILSEALEIRDSLRMSSDYIENPINSDLPPIPPFIISDDIKLIVIGQDQTIKNKDRRKFISSTLNFDNDRDFRYCKSEMNHLSRDFFPFPHQPSIIKKFYSETLDQYAGYMGKTKF